MDYRLLQQLGRQVAGLECSMLMRVALAQVDDLGAGLGNRWLVERAFGMKATEFVEFRFRRDECLEKADATAGRLSAVCVESFAHLSESARRKMVALESKGYEVECFHSLH